jgi:hypothetical protein
MSADRPTFIITLHAEPGVNDILALRALLKLALRTTGCIAKATCSETSMLE